MNLHTLLKLTVSTGHAAWMSAGLAQRPAYILPYKPYTVASADGVRLAMQEWGNTKGPTILFIHGFAASNL